jgi:hypothetical protein
MSVRVVVLGNCQAQMIEGLIARADNVTVDRLPPVFEMSEPQKANVLKKLDAADHIFAQRIGDTYHLPWLQSSFLTTLYGERCSIWPNLYFDGYSPSIRYLYLERQGKINSPLDEYHFDHIIQSFRRGCSIANTVRLLNDDDLDVHGPFEQSLEQLRQRELDCDVTISNAVEEAVFRRQCFYTANHPDSELLSVMAGRLAKAAGLHFDESSATRYVGRLDRIIIPPFKRLSRRYNLPFARDVGYKGLEVTNVSAEKVSLGKVMMYSLQELIEQFYKLYDVVLKNA